MQWMCKQNDKYSFVGCIDVDRLEMKVVCCYKMTGQPLMTMLKHRHLYKSEHKGQILFAHIA